METLWLWVWYVVVVLVIWALLACRGVPGGMALLVASIIGLIVGLILLPQYNIDNLCDEDKMSLNIFIIVAIGLPILALLYVLCCGEYQKFWHKGGGNCFSMVKATCNAESGECKVDKVMEKCHDKHGNVSKVAVKFE